MSRLPEQYGKVAVLLGGTSAEREISLKSGNAVLAALQAAGVDAQAIDPRDGLFAPLQAGGFDRAFIALHGRGGEDGLIQGALEWLGLPYTGSGVLGSAIAMDKLKTKQIWLQSDIPTPPHAVVTNAGELVAFAEQVGYPLAVKPAHEGSSIGMSRLESAADAEAAYAAAAGCDEVVLAERWIQGTEYTASIIGEQVLPLIRLETPRTFYDFEAKYLADNTQYHCPAGLDAAREQQLADLCRRSFAAIGAGGWGRVDLMLDTAGEPWLLEVNTVPGMTDHSLVPMAASQVGMDFAALALRILDTTFDRPLLAGRETP
ncbi:D-alanine-D-alanine ligase [Methylohalomonas lacus]|uniref:D-alanine--D-alanine ligase n=1 Tax=Methylohalomonas lacus TaxID=398773 RepID=A0AAE3HH90_9GAMM|nr:D-alanine--D-alanine ligase [Methylohalomonas lacus]MCS3902256.1 D-alanine-D-alanine ligase [Methylohalomonas lacus]